MATERYEKASEACSVYDSEMAELEKLAGITPDKLGRDRILGAGEHKRRRRACYFAVPDMDLPKRLIAKSRKSHSLFIELLEADLFGQEAKVANIKSSKEHWWFLAATNGVGLIGIASYFFQTDGAIAAAVVAIFFGRYLEDRANQRRQLALDETEEAVKSSKDFLATMSTPERDDFTGFEEVMGQPETE